MIECEQKALGEAMLAQLLVQAELDGADALTLRALVEEASEAGAARALQRIGLEDGRAGRDLHDLRQLLAAWRDVKRTARRTVVGWLIKLLLTALLLGLAMKLNLLGR